jgi:hypothetical protein
MTYFVVLFSQLEFYSMDEKITIIEGPTPIFEGVSDGWALGLNESPFLYELALTRLRTFNSHALVERCHKAWNSQSPIFLHYRDRMGLEEKAPIMAARALETQEGHVLLLWVRLKAQESQIEIDLDDDSKDLNS